MERNFRFYKDPPQKQEPDLPDLPPKETENNGDENP